MAVLDYLNKALTYLGAEPVAWSSPESGGSRAVAASAITVEQIHAEFRSAPEALLTQAKQLLGGLSPVNGQKAERLKRMGFISVPEVRTIERKAREIIEARARLERVLYFRQHYPNQPFITEEIVKQICSKYGLVLGEINKFRGFVPEKNLAEIEAFKLRREDDKIAYRTLLYHAEAGRYNHHSAVRIVSLADWEDRLRPQLDRQPDMYETLGCLSRKIVAPQKDFDMQGMELKGHKLKKVVPPDPIVLQQVDGGYLILTAWGDEASDPLIVNPLNN